MDIVCGGVSALVYCLAAKVLRMEQEGKLVRPAVAEILPGHAVVSAQPRAGAARELREAFCMIFAGLEMVAEEYPQCVAVKRRTCL